jgi:hypothetical protein
MSQNTPKSSTNGSGTNGAGTEPKPNLGQEITKLARLPRADYERQRKDTAKRLGVRVSMLDTLVEERLGTRLTPNVPRPPEVPDPQSKAAKKASPPGLPTRSRWSHFSVAVRSGRARCVSMS